MKWIILLGLLFPIASLAQTDTQAIRFIRHFDFVEEKDLDVVALEANTMGIREASSKRWLILPKYGAVSEYDAERKVASVRDSAFEYTIEEMNYWFEAPVLGDWGVADAQGQWLVPAHYEYPFRLQAQWQIMHASYFESHLYQGLEHVWPGEYQEIVHLKGDLFVLRSARGETGVRNLSTGEWVVKYGGYAEIEGTQGLFMSFPYVDSRTYFVLVQIDDQGHKTVHHGLDQVLQVFKKQGLYIGAQAESGEEGAGKSIGYCIEKDSIFGKWYLHRFWNQLSDPNEEEPSVNNYTDSFKHVVMDSVYGSLPEHWWPYYRIEDHFYAYSIWQSGQRSYSILQADWMNSYGSRGPAVDRLECDWFTAQKVGDQMLELELEDCFANGDTIVLREVLLRQLGDTAGFYVQRFDEGHFSWQLHQDSLLLHYHVEHPFALDNWRKHYRTIAFSSNELGRAFLNERKRARGLKAKFKEQN